MLLPDIVLCEVEWVLDSVYGLSRFEILEVLQRLLDAQEFTFTDHAAVVRAMTSYGSGNADFSDYLIGETATAAGAATTYTFDRALHGSSGFSRPF